MSFTLRIAAKTDPSIRQRDVFAPVATVMAIVLNGLITRELCDGLAAECDRLFAAGADTIVIEVETIRFNDEATRQCFVQNIVSKRGETCHLHVRALDEEHHARFQTLARSADWLMPFDGAADDLPRRSIDVRTPLQRKPP